jgi:A/G-specific adenine glycosylase
MVSPPAREPSRPVPPREDLRDAVLAWFHANGVDYPWRRREDDPYAVWVSEVMLQQTQAARVAQLFPAFLERFPTVASLAAATRADVLRAWAGLGYHRRAVALHEAAHRIVAEHDGAVPSDPDELLTLPGVGAYTAAAVASIAYGAPVAAVDTNVRKVLARMAFGAERDEVGAAAVARAAAAWLDVTRPGDWNQAMMSLGHNVCRTRPRCDECPFASACRFRQSGRAGRPSVRRQPVFEGSVRQTRGRIVTALRDRPVMTLAALGVATGRSGEEVLAAVAGLARDGVVAASARALAGAPGARVRLGAVSR